MVAPALAIIQARLKSHRLARKMLLPLGDTTVLGYAVRTACEFFRDVVVACPAIDFDVIREAAYPAAYVYGYPGDADDVLGRFHACAHYYRTDPKDVIYRLTPDDVPLDLVRERFTLAQLDHWHATATDPFHREHIGCLLPARVEINDQASYEAACRRFPAVLPNCGVTGDISDPQMGELQP